MAASLMDLCNIVWELFDDGKLDQTQVDLIFNIISEEDEE